MPDIKLTYPVRTTNILWAGPKVKYIEYRDRNTLEFAWVPYSIVPNNKILEEDAVIFKSFPLSFKLIDRILFENGQCLNEKGKDMEPPRKVKPDVLLEQLTLCSCPAFKWGWDEKEKTCISLCKDKFPTEYEECKFNTQLKTSELLKAGWKQEKNGWTDGTNGHLISLNMAYKILEKENEE